MTEYEIGQWLLESKAALITTAFSVFKDIPRDLYQVSSETRREQFYTQVRLRATQEIGLSSEEALVVLEPEFIEKFISTSFLN